MRANALRSAWVAGRCTANGWLSIPSAFAAEVMAHQGWDSLTIDLQHGVVDYQAMVRMLQAISTTATVPGVCVPWLEPGILMKSLDAGAYGLICPMVNTREDAQKLVAWTRYAPRGTRSFGPVRASMGWKPSFDDLEPPVAQAVSHILERARAHGIKAGIHCGQPEAALARVAMGFRFVTIGSDARFLAAGSQQVLSRMHG